MNQTTVSIIACILYFLSILLFGYLSRKSLWQMTKQTVTLIRQTDDSLWLLILISLVIVAVPSIIPSTVNDFLLNGWTELLGIIIGVIIIDRLRDAGAKAQKEDIAEESKRQYRQSLIYKVGGKANETAIAAADELRKTGWLVEGKCLVGQNLCGANLRGIDLSGADLSGVNLTDADLTNAKLVKTIFCDAKLVGTIFRHAALDEATLDLADIEKADFSHASLKKASFGKHEENTKSKNIHTATFDHATLHNVKFNNFSTLGSAKFSHCKLHQAEFKHASLQSAIFEGADLERANFTDAILSDADLSRAVCRRTKLNNATMHRATLIDTQFADAVLDDANLNYAFISRKTSFAESSMWKADLSNVTIKPSYPGSEDDENYQLPNGLYWEDLRKKFAELLDIDLSQIEPISSEDDEAFLPPPFYRAKELDSATLPNGRLGNAENLSKYYQDAFQYALDYEDAFDSDEEDILDQTQIPKQF